MRAEVNRSHDAWGVQGGCVEGAWRAHEGCMGARGDASVLWAGGGCSWLKASVTCCQRGTFSGFLGTVGARGFSWVATLMHACAPELELEPCTACKRSRLWQDAVNLFNSSSRILRCILGLSSSISSSNSSHTRA